jgi:asparagine synthetase B (glutamine-hydrolysing)
VDGKELEITADEAFKGYMRDADYRQKTERAAELTRAAEQERQQVRVEREYHANRLDTVASALYQEVVGA